MSDEDLKGEELQEELNRSKAVSDVAKNIVSNGNLILQAHKFKDERMDANNHLPEMLENKNNGTFEMGTKAY